MNGIWVERTDGETWLQAFGLGAITAPELAEPSCTWQIIQDNIPKLGPKIIRANCVS